MLTAIGEELAADFPNAEQLPAQSKKLEETWERSQRDFQLAHDSIRSHLSAKKQLAASISHLEARRAEIQINLGRFEQLEDVYRSDIERLGAIEEAGFLLALGGDKPCPLCGAPPSEHRQVHGIEEIEKARDAANSEVQKIKRQSIDLSSTIEQLTNEGRTIEVQLSELDKELTRIENLLSDLAPAADAAKRQLEESQSVRDHVRNGLALLEQRLSLQKRRDELAALKPARKVEKPRLGVPSTAVHDFAQKVSDVLGEWQFPGKRQVSFDEGTYDLRIDGKNRKDNGKGVRAITHSAFKVALLLFCRERNLPHPGFLVLDTPLLTYRDPLHSKQGPLAADEKSLSNTSLKDFFFDHLSRSAANGQFIVVENIDLPVGIDKLANVETFAGDPRTGRAGLFHPPRHTMKTDPKE